MMDQHQHPTAAERRELEEWERSRSQSEARALEKEQNRTLANSSERRRKVLQRHLDGGGTVIPKLYEGPRIDFSVGPGELAQRQTYEGPDGTLYWRKQESFSRPPDYSTVFDSGISYWVLQPLDSGELAQLEAWKAEQEEGVAAAKLEAAERLQEAEVRLAKRKLAEIERKEREKAEEIERLKSLIGSSPKPTRKMHKGRRKAST